MAFACLNTERPNFAVKFKALTASLSAKFCSNLRASKAKFGVRGPNSGLNLKIRRKFDRKKEEENERG